MLLLLHCINTFHVPKSEAGGALPSGDPSASHRDDYCRRVRTEGEPRARPGTQGHSYYEKKNPTCPAHIVFRISSD